ncbi:rhodanese-like domain-containing protein [Dyadobacter sandarakinus]|uniref:Rhodanese-like domain-containing protein n=1 Tax=Dyadobacter sandarakinus TaxID=2747268 RepID=A0ABX7I6F7_9BACT|nr:rhodanese-like domain-containing protein [Dyadobacter sandarakinus]QRR01684.1 rhodanese-like domain-containing protein [Dyadobacter sandarakinus]
MSERQTFSDIDLATARKLAANPGAMLVDVRENWEFEEFNEGGINIPLAEIRNRRDLVRDCDTIIVICTNGVRSRVAAMDYCRVPEWAEKKIFHVKGGILEAE